MIREEGHAKDVFMLDCSVGLEGAPVRRSRASVTLLRG